MLRIGAHMSVAGGVSKAVDRAALHGCESLQIFTKNASRWQSPPLDPGEIRRFRERLEETGIRPAVSHASYLINLASSAPVLREQSIDALVDEMDRAHALGLLGVVLHPGACASGGDEPSRGVLRRSVVSEEMEADALRLIAQAIATALERRPRMHTAILLEHTAGQGRTLGHRFEHLAAIIGHLGGAARVGVCLDTCHLTASGYDIASEAGYRETFAEFERLVGVERLKVFHGNDSKKPCASRVDRHEHIGEGCVGLEAFQRLMHDARFDGLPILIETEKSSRSQRPNVIARDPLDVKNLDLLRRLRGDAYRSNSDYLAI